MDKSSAEASNEVVVSELIDADRGAAAAAVVAAGEGVPSSVVDRQRLFSVRSQRKPGNAPVLGRCSCPVHIVW